MRDVEKWDKMGNQIKFSPKSKDRPLPGENDKLEIEIIQLKNTNRNLISRLDQEKQLNKTLKQELESIKKDNDLSKFNKLKDDYIALKRKNDHLEKLLVQSHKEIRILKNEIKKLKQEAIQDSKNSGAWSKIKKLRN